MSATPETAPQEPKLLYKNLTSGDPRSRGAEIDAAVHEFVTFYRNRPQFLVMHPADYDEILPHIARSDWHVDQVTDRVHAGLDRGTVILADADNDEWQTPPTR